MLKCAVRLTGVRPHFAVYQSCHIDVVFQAFLNVNKGLYVFFTMNIETGKTAPFVKFTLGDPRRRPCASPET
jgi:hypothetical protein